MPCVGFHIREICKKHNIFFVKEPDEKGMKKWQREVYNEQVGNVTRRKDVNVSRGEVHTNKHEN